MKAFDPDTQATRDVPDAQALELELRAVAPVLSAQSRKRDLYFLVANGVGSPELYRRLAPRFDALGYDLLVAPYRGPRLPLPEQPAWVVVARPHAPRRLWLHAVLLVATILTTTLAGAELMGVPWWAEPGRIPSGLPFSGALLLVLGTHELAHSVTARRHGMKASLPFFIPLPPFGMLGTLGAVISHRGPVPDRRVLFDVGLSGPLVGLAAAVAVTFVGLRLPFETPPPLAEAVQNGEAVPELGLPPLFALLARITGFQGPALHPVAFAGWVGMFVTVFNLLPVGQLDGGHVARAVLGARHEKLSRHVPILLVLAGLALSLRGILADYLIFWGFFAWLFARGGHPPPLDDSTPLDRRRMAVAVLTIGLAALSFTPVPFQIHQAG